MADLNTLRAEHLDRCADVKRAEIEVNRVRGLREEAWLDFSREVARRCLRRVIEDNPPQRYALRQGEGIDLTWGLPKATLLWTLGTSAEYCDYRVFPDRVVNLPGFWLKYDGYWHEHRFGYSGLTPAPYSSGLHMSGLPKEWANPVEWIPEFLRSDGPTLMGPSQMRRVDGFRKGSRRNDQFGKVIDLTRVEDWHDGVLDVLFGERP